MSNWLGCTFILGLGSKDNATIVTVQTNSHIWKSGNVSVTLTARPKRLNLQTLLVEILTRTVGGQLLCILLQRGKEADGREKGTVGTASDVKDCSRLCHAAGSNAVSHKYYSAMNTGLKVSHWSRNILYDKSPRRDPDLLTFDANDPVPRLENETAEGASVVRPR